MSQSRARPVTTDAIVDSAGDTTLLERAVAVIAVFLLASRLAIHPALPVGYGVAMAALPVSASVASRYRGARFIFFLSLLATASGLFLTWAVAPPDFVSSSQTVIQAGRIVMIGVGSLMLLWARTVLGSRTLVMTYAVGTLASLVVVGVNADNLWKFSFAVPITLLALSLRPVYGRPAIEMTVLLALGVVSALQDSRSAAAMMLLAGGLVVTGRGRSDRSTRARVVLGKLAIFGAGSFYMLQAALLNGDLGESARQRSMAQIETSGSLLLGGRPELGASVALLQDQPWGYGLGSLVTPTQVDIAKAGMARLGYDPNNGYVENYMFGNGFEVHSLLGDMALLAGPPGVVAAAVVIGLVTWGMAQHLGRRAASGVMIFLSVRAMWDFAFSPLPSALLTLMLCIALALPARQGSLGRHSVLASRGAPYAAARGALEADDALARTAARTRRGQGGC